MSRDRLDERYAALFEAARRERAPEATRQRIATALRARPRRVGTPESSAARWTPVRLALAVAATALALVVVIALKWRGDSIPISAEALAPPSAQPRATVATDPEQSARSPVQAPPRPSAMPVDPVNPRATNKRQPPPAPASLEQELASMQRARASLGQGDAASTLAELDRFGRGPGFQQLAAEASLLRIEALARVGRAQEASALARGFVAQHPNNPLVDRARTFITPAAAGGVDAPPEENEP